jgi:hypothetical protein
MGGFTAWLEAHAQVKAGVGDLARDAAADPDWPQGPDELQTWLDYLVLDRGLDEEAPAVLALREAWELYRG